MPTKYIFKKLNELKDKLPVVSRLFSLPLMLITVWAIFFSTPIHAAEECQESILEPFESSLAPLPIRKLFFIYGKRGNGYINNRGKVVLKPRYSLVDEVFADGWGCVADKNFNEFFLDETGKKRIHAPGKRYLRFTDRMLSFQKADQGIWLYGFMDNTGKVAIPPIFADVHEFGEGLAAARKPGGKFGFIDKKGNFVIEPRFDTVDTFSDGLAAVEVLSCSQCSYIDRSGKPAMKASFKSCYRFADGVARVKTIEGKWGYIDHSGKVISESVSPNAAEFEFFSEGLSNVMVPGNKVGYINTKGEFVIPPRFKYALPFSEGLAEVCDENDKWGYINKTGSYVIQPRFCAPDGPTHGFFSEGLAFACDPKTKKYGYIDRSGKWVISPRFDACEESSGYNCQFSGGLAWVETDTELHSGGHYHYVNRKGKYVWSFPIGEKGDDKTTEQFREIMKRITQ